MAKTNPKQLKPVNPPVTKTGYVDLRHEILKTVQPNGDIPSFISEFELGHNQILIYDGEKWGVICNSDNSTNPEDHDVTRVGDIIYLLPNHYVTFDPNILQEVSYYMGTLNSTGKSRMKDELIFLPANFPNMWKVTGDEIEKPDIPPTLQPFQPPPGYDQPPGFEAQAQLNGYGSGQQGKYGSNLPNPTKTSNERNPTDNHSATLQANVETLMSELSRKNREIMDKDAESQKLANELARAQVENQHLATSVFNNPDEHQDWKDKNFPALSHWQTVAKAGTQPKPWRGKSPMNPSEYKRIDLATVGNALAEKFNNNSINHNDNHLENQAENPPQKPINHVKNGHINAQPFIPEMRNPAYQP
ncbi:MAG: hypothetical protein GY696_35195, partial [Gammaproteobacteria bacterium]|nr:hypothetical protein [Gammaproteobacteria bacterium]